MVNLYANSEEKNIAGGTRLALSWERDFLVLGKANTNFYPMKVRPVCTSEQVMAPQFHIFTTMFAVQIMRREAG
tara:strand:- start:308 stop:529 length:222 start_codon:yes stop_codon:yes gene_type:complete